MINEKSPHSSPAATPSPQGEGMTRLLTYEEAMSAVGVGWEEVWHEPYLVGGNLEYKALYKCVFIGGNVLLKCGSIDHLELEKHYNWPYNFRIWLGEERPTDEQRAAAPWEEVEAPWEGDEEECSES